MQSIYLDYASTTPLDKRVAKAMEPFLGKSGDFFGNPSSLHHFGQKALAALDKARGTVARAITAYVDDIVFTASATEANNLVIRGALKAYYRARKTCRTIPKIIVSAIEHASVLETVRDLERDGAVRAVYLPVSREGIVDAQALVRALDRNTIVVSVMWVNNETGAIQPVAEISKIVRDFRLPAKRHTPSPYPLFHTDAAQAGLLCDLNVIASGVDAITLSSHKIYGPKGVGALYLNSDGRGDKTRVIAPLVTGGGHEQGLRSGTSNVASIVGFAQALELCVRERTQEYSRLSKLSLDFYRVLRQSIGGIEINGSLESRSPHILNLFFPHKDALGRTLDVAGIAVSSGAACAQRRVQPSHVLKAMGYNNEHIRASVRFSFGRFTTKKEVDETARRIIMVCTQ